MYFVLYVFICMFSSKAHLNSIILDNCAVQINVLLLFPVTVTEVKLMDPAETRQVVRNVFEHHHTF